MSTPLLEQITADAIEPALVLLPVAMDTPEAATIKAAQQSATNTLQGLTINQPVSEVRPMADANSTRPPVAGRSSNGTPLYECICSSCGGVRLADYRKLGKRCHPCAMRERNTTHGLSSHPLYKLLKNIEVRCYYPSATNYEYYGGRGISVCDEWRNDPATFVKWTEGNGYSPGLEVDRIDNDGPYAPWNCRFVSHVANSQLRGNAKCDTQRARQVKNALASGSSVKAAAKAVGVPYMVAWHISKGHSWRDA